MTVSKLIPLKSVTSKTGSKSRSQLKSKSKSNSLAFTDSEDDAFLKEWAMKKMRILEQAPVDPSTVVFEFLKKTKIPYVIIGGKAAAFHIGQLSDKGNRSPSTTKTMINLAMSTKDYDIVVREKHADDFIFQLQTALREGTTIPLHEKTFSANKNVNIILMGTLVGDIFNSVVDVHIIKEAYDYHYPSKVVKDAVGLRYAPIDWICKELSYSMQYSSEDEMTKHLKRQARHELLQCAKFTNEKVMKVVRR